MTLYKATPEGTIPFTPEEEAVYFERERQIEEEFKAKAWPNARSQRNGLLYQSDWTQLPDTKLTDEQKATWATYRQALRDITKQTDPLNIVWPTPPV